VMVPRTRTFVWAVTAVQKDTRATSRSFFMAVLLAFRKNDQSIFAPRDSGERDGCKQRFQG
jgi:hypothetical protein